MNVLEEPVRLSQYFVNKHNVRSFGNLTKIEKEDHLFLLQVFDDKTLVCSFPLNFIEVLFEFKDNVKKHSKLDFKENFKNESTDNILKAVDKNYVFNTSFSVLNEIIPKSLYGSPNNFQIFKNIVKSVIYSMKGQNFVFQTLLLKWNYTLDPWKKFSTEIAVIIVKKLILWLVKFVLSPMICLNFYVTTCKLDIDENKLFYFWKNQWQRFYDKKITNLVTAKVIMKNDSYSLGKRVKRNHSVRHRLVLKNIQKEIPKLHLVLKPNNDFRPIVRYKRDLTPTEKYKIKYRLNFLKTLTGKKGEKIESQYSTLYKKWVSQEKPKLYFIKADLSNAFGSILKGKLARMLCERHLSYQKTEKNIDMKKKFAQHYKNMLDELRKPLLVRAGSTVYEWKEGLVQGYKYSPALSELYYTCLDESFFKSLLQDSSSNIRLFVRVVDDYLFITDSKDDAHSFLDALSNHRNVNFDKTVVNFEYPRIRFSDQITFLGYSYNTKNLQVSRANNVYAGQMCYKIAFTEAISNTYQFIESRIGQSGIQINNHLFNFHYNDEELTWSHSFTTFCLSANKFCTILSILCNPCENLSYLQLYKKRVVVKLTNQIIETLNKSKPADFLFMYCINHFRYLAWKALYLCAKDTTKCRPLLPKIKDEIAKSNCLFGKWRDHASRIELNGEMLRKANRDVCKRSDLKEIMKSFESLPIGFKCFDKKSFS